MIGQRLRRDVRRRHRVDIGLLMSRDVRIRRRLRHVWLGRLLDHDLTTCNRPACPERSRWACE